MSLGWRDVDGDGGASTVCLDQIVGDGGLDVMDFWMVVSNIFVILTLTWGRWTHFDEHIFQMGWNHQLDLLVFFLDLQKFEGINNLREIFGWGGGGSTAIISPKPKIYDIFLRTLYPHIQCNICSGPLLLWGTCHDSQLSREPCYATCAAGRFEFRSKAPMSSLRKKISEAAPSSRGANFFHPKVWWIGSPFRWHPNWKMQEEEPILILKGAIWSVQGI